MPDWKKIEDGVLGATDVPTGERSAWLDRYCAGDAELRSEIESLLEMEPAAEDFLERSIKPLSRSLGGNGENARAESHFGPYKVVKRIGRGGMGSVYLAVRADREFNKRVAIKVLRRGMDTEDILRRFRQERQILAALEHPNIARLLDGGMSDDGMPYFVMEYVEGEPFDKYCDGKKLDANERLRLFLKICSAVSYAHQNLVVHRDLKPSNILITKDGEPKLLDFGIAKFLNPELSSQTIAPTATFVRLMTPEYASPEQIRGKNITTASDVYSLGVVLYKALTGQNPHRFQNTSPQEIERVVCESEPSRPSDVARNTASGDSAPAGHRAELDAFSLRGDLDNIVLTALRKEPERRYASVSDLAADIQRYLDGRPVAARPNTFGYRAAKFVRRNRVGVAAAAAVFLAIVGALGFSVWQAEAARRERDAAQAERARAEKISQFLSAALAYSDPSAGSSGTGNKRDATINEMLDDFAPKIATELASQPEVRASLQRTVGAAYISQLRFADAEKYLNAALETQKQVYGESHHEVALTLRYLGETQASKGDYAAAEKTLEQAISIYRGYPPAADLHVHGFVEAYNFLGYSHWTRGNYAAADAAHVQALELAVRIAGDRQPLASSKLGLGIARYAQGRLDESVLLLREAVDEYRKMSHLRWKLPEALNFLGQVLTWKREYEESLSVLQESEEISRDVWGDNSALRARALYLKVYALCFKGECRKAEAALLEAERIYNEHLPENKVAKANNLDARNLIYTRTGRAAEGEALGRRAIELYSSSMNRGAASITLAKIHLAENLISQRRHSEAVQLLVEAHKDASEVQGPDHWRTREVSAMLASLYAETGRPDLAAPYR